MSIVLQGSTSGSITLQEPAVAGTTVLDLPSVSGTLITTASSGQSIPKAALPTGSILQVVQATTNSSITTTSGSFVATGFTASITPTSASSKVMVMLNGGNYFNDTDSREAWTVMYRSIGGGAYSQLPAPYNQIVDISGAYGAVLRISHSVCVLDSPATTSSVTYQPYMANSGGGTTYFNANSPVVTLTLMEISA